MATQHNSPIRVNQLRTDNITPSTFSGSISISTPTSMSIVAAILDFDTDVVFNREIQAVYIKADSGNFTGSFNGALVGTASWSSNAVTASFAPNYVLISQTGSLVALSSSFASTASYINPTFISASAAASGFGSGGTIDTSSLVTTSSFNSFTSSYSTGSFTGSFYGEFIGSASYATTASYAESTSGPKIYVSTTEPVSPNPNDIWIKY